MGAVAWGRCKCNQALMWVLALMITELEN
jgi:hypothetical protein